MQIEIMENFTMHRPKNEYKFKNVIFDFTKFQNKLFMSVVCRLK